MNRIKYDEIVNFIVGNISQEWNNQKIKQLEKESKNYEVKYKILYRKRINEKSLRVLKEDEIDSVIFMMHNHSTGGHFGKDATYNRISTRFYWKGMYKDIEKYIRTCDSCQRRGNKGGVGCLNPIKVGKPFERIGIDFVGPLEKTRKENKYILVVT